MSTSFFSSLEAVTAHIKILNSERQTVKSVILTHDGKWILTHFDEEVKIPRKN